MTVHDRIEINPKIMLGKPVIRGTRIPVESIVRKMSEGADEKALLQAYPTLTSNDVHAGFGTLRIRLLTKKLLWAQRDSDRLVRLVADENCDFSGHRTRTLASCPPADSISRR